VIVHNIYVTYHIHQPNTAFPSSSTYHPTAAHHSSSDRISAPADSLAPLPILPYPVDTNVAFKQIEAWPAVTRVHGSYAPVAVSPGDSRHAPPNTTRHVGGDEAETSRTSTAYKHTRTRPTVSPAHRNRTEVSSHSTATSLPGIMLHPNDRPT
jgi:hypothetical protein